MMVNLIPLIKTITIFKSSRAVEMNGQKVDHMQPIAMINGELYGYAENVDDLFVKVVEEELEKSVEHITVLLGNGLTNKDVPRLEKLLKTNLPDLSEDIIEVHVGDQPHYDYLISVLQN
jgi:dihydroxyacetone kinase-like predicted kinase